MKPRTFVPLLVLYALALAGLYFCRTSLDALMVTLVVMAMIIIPPLLLRATRATRSMSTVWIGVALFGTFAVAQYIIVTQPDAIAALTANSAWLNGNHVKVSFDQPIPNTLTAVAASFLLHWKLNGPSRKVVDDVADTSSDRTHARI